MERGMKTRESHMYHIPFVNDIRYFSGPAVDMYIDRQGRVWSHSLFCQCHLELKLRGTQ